MVPKLADKLIERYADKNATIFDPFCGSGELLVKAAAQEIEVAGCDINPYAVLLSRVRVEGFSMPRSTELLGELLHHAARVSRPNEMEWSNKAYWFSKRVLEKYEMLRAAAVELQLGRSKEGRAVLLALAMSARICSRADERSPKPFISRDSIRRKCGRHIDPATTIARLHGALGDIHGSVRHSGSNIVVRNWAIPVAARPKQYSLIMTSPPYLNAQDYFRNSMLELYLLEGLLDFRVASVMTKFVGTERGLSLQVIDEQGKDRNRSICPELRRIERASSQHAAVVHRYFYDMHVAINNIDRCLRIGGKFVLVCGDNLIASQRIRTWACLRKILRSIGWKEVDHFADRIRNRALAPRRSGHKGLIKEERVLVFEKPGHTNR